MTPLRAALLVAILLAAGAATYYFWPGHVPPPPPPLPAPAVPAAAAPAGPRHPVAVEAPAALPALNDSDAAMVEALSRLLGLEALARMLNPEGLVRNIVATVDNLPREELAQRVSPVKPVGGLFVASGKEGALAIGAKNAARYEPYVRAMEAVDTGKLVAVYRHFYPLFQQAYVDLGYPNGYFNDRLVEVIDHLLETPEPTGPVKLTQAKVLYEFADPALQERSAGQKTLLRMGTANAVRVKAKLREIRREVAAQ